MTAANCIYCKKELNPDGPATIRKISGWVENSKTGRPTKIKESTDLGLYAHPLCYDRAQRGFVEQGGLF